MMPVFDSRIEQALDERRKQGLSRDIKVLNHGNRGAIEFAGSGYVNFSSNDYLGLASDPEVVKAWQEGLERYGAGSGASPLVTGFSYAHQDLEETLCEWLGFERAILFSSGFSANQALLFSILEKNDLLIQDKLNHASLMEAGILSPATMKRFRHNDVLSLQKLLASDSNSLVVTEGVFSMDGDKSPLSAINNACKRHRSWLMVDDAHGVGVLGEQGRGSCAEAGIVPDLLVVTFGKAFGLSGAAIMCNSNVGDYLTQFARHHVYSTAIPPSQAHTLGYITRMIQRQQWRRDKLSELQSAYEDELADTQGYVQTETPIKPYICGDAETALQMADKLKRAGFWATAIRPPTVPAGSARLRITLTAQHSIENVRSLGKQIKQWSKQEVAT